MALLASDILTEARSLLNDPSGAIYQTTPMIALLNKVYRELQTKVSALGISTTRELSSAIDVTAGTTSLSDGAGLPSTLLYPISLKERAKDSTEDYTDMDEYDWESNPNVAAEDTLGRWAWREDQIKFPAALTDREVLIKFAQTLGAVTATTSPIYIINSQQWLAQRLASVAALVLGSNPTRAAALAGDLVTLWDDLRSTLVKRRQARPVRRRRTRFRVL